MEVSRIIVPTARQGRSQGENGNVDPFLMRRDSFTFRGRNEEGQLSNRAEHLSVIVPYPGTFVKKSWQKNFSRKKVKRNLHMTSKVLRSSRYTMIVYLPQWEIWVKFCLQRWAINNSSPTLKSWSPDWESSSPFTNSSSPTFPILNGGGGGEGGIIWKKRCLL